MKGEREKRERERRRERESSNCEGPIFTISSKPDFVLKDLNAEMDWGIGEGRHAQTALDTHGDCAV